MNNRNKEALRDGFGSLINNAAAIRGAKNGPLWVTIAMFVLSILLPIIPIFVAQTNINGSFFLNTYSYGIEKHLTSIGLDLKDNRNAEFIIGEDHLLSVTENNVPINFDDYGTVQPYAAYTNAVTNQYDFLVYLVDAPTISDKRVINTNIVTMFYELGTTQESSSSDDAYRPSYLILYKDGLYVSLFENSSIEPIANSYVGDFKTTKPSTTFLTDLLTVRDKNEQLVTASILSVAYTDGVLKNFKNVLNVSYETQKVYNLWMSSGVYAAVFLGLGILMGFLMWVLTRGKNNPNNYFSWWLCAKIEARLAFSPALITLVVGFFLASQAPLIYIMTLGVRVMWISMKELRPVQA
ncbi:MAG: hypothetical protein GX813_00825 [Erysipelotrichia bacterium]|nr:hypothetical protein [Erysipelotrichia bacterium]